MQHRGKTYIVGDRVLVNKQQGTVKYIGELRSSNKIWIGVDLDSNKANMKKKLLEKSRKNEEEKESSKKIKNKNKINELETNNDGSIDNIVYIENNKNKNKKMNILFIEACKINKWLRGCDNNLLSRDFYINQEIWIKSIKCKGIIKSMFYLPPKYIIEQINIKNEKQRKKSNYKQCLGILLKKPFGNNVKNTIKYFECEDNYDYFIKLDAKQIIPINEYNERLSSNNLELIIDRWFHKLFINDINHKQIAQELINLLISFFGAMDGTLNLKKHQVYKYKEECLDLNDYYEYDSVYLGEGSRLFGGKLISIKCFGDFVMDENAEISVSATVNLYQHELDKNNKLKSSQFVPEKKWNLKFGAKGYDEEYNYGGKGGGIIKIICFGNVILRCNALICANGENGNLRAKYGGGGTIYIKCDKLINHGKIFAVGHNNTGPIYYDHHLNRWNWENLMNEGTGPNGQIIIDGKYSEDGHEPINTSYCGPILMPIQPHLNHKSMNIR